VTTVPAGNRARFAAKPLTHSGTPVPLWLAAFQEAPLPALNLAGCPGLVVVAAHPDDETLGVGAMITQLVAIGVRVQVVCVSDGGARPGSAASERLRAQTIRRFELRSATNTLNAPPPLSLGLPGGELTAHEERLTGALTEILRAAAPGAWCAAPWRGAGHPDHEAVGHAAWAACAHTGAALLEYPVWMWHWAVPGDPAVPWDRAHAVPAPAWAVSRKRLAAQRYRSRFEPTGGSAPALPGFVLARLLAVGEVVFR